MKPLLNSYLKICVLHLFICSGFVSSQSLVEYLPGFTGKLPFTLETGYVGVGESEEVQFFYYFVESEGDAENDPLLLWLTGGPSCSGLSGLACPIGPIYFDSTRTEYYDDTALPKLIHNPYSWTKVASILFMDQPAGSGFSYGTTSEAYDSSDSLNSEHIYQFLRKWLTTNHPKFLKNPLYIGGDSYAGIFVPLVVDNIYNGNDAGTEPLLNIKGYIEGNALTDWKIDYNAMYLYAHRMGLLPDKLFQPAYENCEGDFYNPPNNLCQNHLQRIQECLGRINAEHILERWCDPHWKRQRRLSVIKPPLSLKPTEQEWMEDNYVPLYNTWANIINSDQEQSLFSILNNIDERDHQVINDASSSYSKPIEQGCMEDYYVPFYAWANKISVRRALHIREGTIGEWVRCNKSYKFSSNWGRKVVEQNFYKFDVDTVVPYHKKFTRKHCRALIYSGDHDMKIAHLGTEKWIESLSVPIRSDWRAWFVQGQTAGYTMRYEDGGYNLTYVTVKGAGHIAPDYKPLECLAMIHRWLSYSDL